MRQGASTAQNDGAAAAGLSPPSRGSSGGARCAAPRAPQTLGSRVWRLGSPGARPGPAGASSSLTGSGLLVRRCRCCQAAVQCLGRRWGGPGASVKGPGASAKGALGSQVSGRCPLARQDQAHCWVARTRFRQGGRPLCWAQQQQQQAGQLATEGPSVANLPHSCDQLRPPSPSHPSHAAACHPGRAGVCCQLLPHNRPLAPAPPPVPPVRPSAPQG